MRTIICATIAVLLVGTAGAQDFFGIPGFPTATTTISTAVLTKAERGKAMIGLCYSTCAHRYQKATIHMLESLDDADEDGQQCFMAQTFIRSMDTFQAPAYFSDNAALPASDQIQMRESDGWETLNQPIAVEILDRAA